MHGLGEEGRLTRTQNVVTLSAAAMMVAGAVLVAQQNPIGRAVNLSVVVADKNGRPIRGLVESDFRVRENGREMTLNAFQPVTAADAAQRGRSIVLLLGGSGVDARLTARVQEIARDLVNRAGDADKVSVVRFANGREELAGSRNEMLMRIAEYRAGYGEGYNPKTSEGVLRRIAKLSRELEAANAPGRRAIVWIGAAAVVDVRAPIRGHDELLWPYWVEAITAAANANASVYAIDPAGLTGRVRLNPDGLIADTGGAAFDDSNDFGGAVERVWQDLSTYYSLGYHSSAWQGELQSIDVKVSQPTGKVTARRHR